MYQRIRGDLSNGTTSVSRSFGHTISVILVNDSCIEEVLPLSIIDNGIPFLSQIIALSKAEKPNDVRICKKKKRRGIRYAAIHTVVGRHRCTTGTVGHRTR